MNSNSINNVCIVTWYRSINYGTVVQCLALSKAVEGLGYQACVPERMNYWTVAEPSDFVRRFYRKIRNRIKLPNAQVARSAVASEILEGYRKREERINRLIDDELNVYRIKNRSSFRKLSDEMDAFVTGSDQIWNPNYVSSPYLLSFVHDNKLKIAYSSSIGVARLPKNLTPMYKRYLSRFLTIGVREKSAELLLRDIVDVPVCTVLDPSFLLNREEWRIIAAKAEIPNEYRQMKGFIFCYFIGGKQGWKKDAEALSEKYGIPVVCCLSESFIVPEKAHVFADAGVREFLWMIDHASIILTDSFHAVALSLNHEKEFVVYKRFNDTDKASQNSRIIDVLDMFGVRERLVTEARTAEQILEMKIAYAQVSGLMEREKQRSIAFLKRALEGKIG